MKHRIIILPFIVACFTAIPAQARYLQMMQQYGYVQNRPPVISPTVTIQHIGVRPVTVSVPPRQTVQSTVHTAVLSSGLQAVAQFQSKPQFVPQDQYHDGMNLFQYVKSNPVLFLDPKGTRIYLITGNDSSSPVNNALHQNVCVDKWKKAVVSGHIVWTTDEKECFSFAMTGLGLTRPKKTWLGFKSTVLGGCLKGEIYKSTNTAGKTEHWKLTTVAQDLRWLLYMNGRVGTKDVYSLFRHNCRTYAQLEFEAAPGHLDIDAITGL